MALPRIAQNISLLGVIILLLWEFSQFSLKMSIRGSKVQMPVVESIQSLDNSTQHSILQHSLSIVPNQVNNLRVNMDVPLDLVNDGGTSKRDEHYHSIPGSTVSTVDRKIVPRLPPLAPPPLPPLPIIVSKESDIGINKGNQVSPSTKSTQIVHPVIPAKNIPVTPLAQTSQSNSQCTGGVMPYYSASPNSRVPMLKIPIHKVNRCQYSVSPKDIVVGVWHCKKCEPQLNKVRDTWGRRFTTVYLASSVGAKGSKFNDLLITSEPKDDYLSTLGKGFMGLKHMYEKFPNKKW